MDSRGFLSQERENVDKSFPFAFDRIWIHSLSPFFIIQNSLKEFSSNLKLNFSAELKCIHSTSNEFFLVAVSEYKEGCSERKTLWVLT